MMQLKLRNSDKTRSISSKSSSGRWKYFLLFLAIILGSLVWVGAQLDSSQRIESLKWLIPEGMLNQEIISPYFDHLQIIIDTIYEAVEATKVACFIWSKVGFLTMGPVMKFFVAIGIQVGFLFSFLYPYIFILSNYLSIIWENFLIVLSHVYVILKPYLIQLLGILGEGSNRAVVLFFEQDKWNIFFEILTPLSILIIVLLKKEFTKRQYDQKIKSLFGYYRELIALQYQRLILYIQKKSLWVASFIPHMLLIIPIGIMIYFIPELLFSISRGYILLIVSLCYPMFNSVHSIQSDNYIEKKRSLSYWIVFSIISLIQGLILHIPFVSRLTPDVPYIQECLFFYFLWLQLPWTDGSSIMYKLVVPFVSKVLSLLPIPKSVDKTVESLPEEKNFVVNLLINTIVPENYRTKTIEFLFHSGYLAGGVIFFFTPSYFTSLGCLLIGLLLPYYASINAIVNSNSAAKVSHDFATEIFALHHFPFWYAGKLAIILWLQVPLFRGAEKIYKKFILKSYNFLTSIFETASSSKYNILTPRNKNDIDINEEVDSNLNETLLQKRRRENSEMIKDGNIINTINGNDNSNNNSAEDDNAKAKGGKIITNNGKIIIQEVKERNEIEEKTEEKIEGNNDKMEEKKVIIEEKEEI